MSTVPAPGELRFLHRRALASTGGVIEAASRVLPPAVLARARRSRATIP